MGVEKDGNWLYSEWKLTYRVGWGHICSAASLIYQYTTDPEILAGDANGEREVAVDDAEQIRSLDEYGYLVIRGTSEMIGVPLSIG